MRHRSGLKLTVLVFFSLSGANPGWAGSDVNTAADVVRILLPATGYAMTFYYHDPEGRGQFWKALLTTTAVTYALKVTIDAEGPNGHEQAFPSGHAALAFSGASFIQRRYGWQSGLPAYAAASLVGWSRVDSDDHDTADVIAGAAIGVASTYLFTSAFARSTAIVPVAGDDSLGVRILGRW